MKPVLSAVFTLFVSTQSMAAYSFGYDGRDGSSGRTGYSGQSGQQILVQAGSVAQSFRLDGAPGSDGQSGQDADDASSCYQPNRPRNDLQGANGGDGGSSGDGGDGGSGGHAEIYYNSALELKNIFISAMGAPGGRAGNNAGRAGRPCYCQEGTWEHVDCHDEKDRDGKIVQICNRERYSCYDGRMGREGGYGRDGSNGSIGSITIIKSATPLLNDILNDSASVAEALARNLHVAKNDFQYKSGALSLLAPGSRVNDTYSEFVGRQEHLVQVQWQAQRKVDEFAQSRVDVNLINSQAMVSFSQEMWAVVDQSEANGTQLVKVLDVAKADEMKNISFDVSGKGRAAILTIKDNAPLQGHFVDQISLKAWHDNRVFSDDIYFEGQVPSQLIQRQGNQIIIQIGQLKIQDIEKNFSNSNRVLFELRVTRSMQSHSVYTAPSIKHYF
jgi:hypothetical protein